MDAFVCVFRATAIVSKEFLLALGSGIAPGECWVSYVMPGIKSRWAICKVSTICTIFLIPEYDKLM